MTEHRFLIILSCGTAVAMTAIGAQCSISSSRDNEKQWEAYYKALKSAPAPQANEPPKYKVGDCVKNMTGVPGVWSYQQDRGCWLKTQEVEINE